MGICECHLGDEEGEGISANGSRIGLLASQPSRADPSKCER